MTALKDVTHSRNCSMKSATDAQTSFLRSRKFLNPQRQMIRTPVATTPRIQMIKSLNRLIRIANGMQISR